MINSPSDNLTLVFNSLALYSLDTRRHSCHSSGYSRSLIAWTIFNRLALIAGQRPATIAKIIPARP